MSSDDVPVDDGLVADDALDRAVDRAVDRANRLYELAAEIPTGPYTHRRSADGALILWAGDEPIAHVYGGLDLAKWFEATAPVEILGDGRS